MRRALAFLTPLGRATPPGPEALAWFPAVGAGLGLALGAVWWVAGRWWPPAVAAALVVVADLGLTGMLHFDGLVDAADGLLAQRPPAERLRIMAAPDAGAFGIAAAGAALLCRWAALVSLRPAPLLLAALWTLSRAAMAVVVATQRYARGQDGGLVSAFGPGRAAGRGVVPVAATAVALVVAGVWRLPAGPVAVVSGAAGASAVVALARRRIGGYTGDVLGAAGVVAETLGLMVAAARW